MIVRSGHAGLRRGLLPRRLFGHARRRVRLRRRVGEEHVRLPVDGLEARRLALAGCRHLLGQIENVIGGRRSPARRRVESPPASHRRRAVPWLAGGGAGGWRRRRCGLRGGMAAGRGAGAAGGGAGLAAAGLAVSSSAMMRRMEARISSIDGSCAFAGWLIANPYSAESRQSPHDARGIERPQRITRSLDIYSDRRKYGTAYFERKRSLVDRHTSPRRRLGNLAIIRAVELFSVGRAHAHPGVAHLMVVHLRVIDRHSRGPAPAATAAPTPPAANKRRRPGRAGR